MSNEGKTAPTLHALEALLQLSERATPGPWQDVPARPGYITTVIDNFGDGVAFATNEGRKGIAQQNADAALIAAAVNFIREHGPALRSLAGGGAGGGCPYCRLAESAHPQPAQVDEWRPTYGREPEGWRDHRLMFLCWEDGTIEASECYGTIAWDETTHWVPAKKPTKPALTGAAKHE